MSEEYIKSIFDIMDGKAKFSTVDQKKRGRKPGYKHSKETKAKIADRMRDRVKTEEVKDKISNSLKGRPKPDEVREKISKAKTKHTVAGDLLDQYIGRSKEKDVPTSTQEWVAKCGHNPLEICEWIQEHYQEFNDCDGVYTESFLKAVAIKEEAILEEFDSGKQEDWR
jgi:hypothetical protein